MNKSLISAATVATLLIAGAAHAQTGIVIDATASTDGTAAIEMIEYAGETGVVIPARPPLPMRPPLTPVRMYENTNNPPRETNRQIIERMRNLKGQNLMEARLMNTATGSVRIQRADAARPIPADIRGNAFVRINASSSGTTTPRGFFIRALSASGSRAIFLREASSSGDMPWGRPQMMRFEATTSADGTVLMRMEDKRPPLEMFMNRIFNIFKREPASEARFDAFLNIR
jgi:hypothetical protein